MSSKRVVCFVLITLMLVAVLPCGTAFAAFKKTSNFRGTGTHYTTWDVGGCVTATLKGHAYYVVDPNTSSSLAVVTITLQRDASSGIINETSVYISNTLGNTASVAARKPSSGDYSTTSGSKSYQEAEYRYKFSASASDAFYGYYTGEMIVN